MIYTVLKYETNLCSSSHQNLLCVGNGHTYAHLTVLGHTCVLIFAINLILNTGFLWQTTKLKSYWRCCVGNEIVAFCIYILKALSLKVIHFFVADKHHHHCTLQNNFVKILREEIINVVNIFSHAIVRLSCIPCWIEYQSLLFS